MLHDDMKACVRCPLRAGCNQVVTGIGDLHTSLLIVGEAPGEDEDLEGEPFVGRSGQLLRKLLNDAGIDPLHTYISNAVKCRPPGNRKPTPEELDICKIWLWKEIQLLTNVKAILTLGATPTALLLKLKNITMGDLVGRSFSVPYTQAKVMPWYHPSFLLRRNKAVTNEGQKLMDRTKQWLTKVKELAC